ncbi:MAG: HIT family protein [Candidatus Omnitrophota bacterium]
MSDCIFCKNIPRVMENELAYAAYDIHPLTKGHVLIIPKRHFEQVFDATDQESAAIKDLLVRMKGFLTQAHAPDGFNIMINCGVAAGQVVMHAHIHLIPRYKGQALHIREHIQENTE